MVARKMNCRWPRDAFEGVLCGGVRRPSSSFPPSRPHSSSMSSSSLKTLRKVVPGRPPHLSPTAWRLRVARRTVTVVLQSFCIGSVIASNLAEVRWTVGTSMLPTLAADDDVVLVVRIKPLSYIRGLMLQLKGTRHLEGVQAIKGNKWAAPLGIGRGDLIVATSPINPERGVCKRVIGLPGDTVLVDPRLAPILPSSSLSALDLARDQELRRTAWPTERLQAEDVELSRLPEEEEEGFTMLPSAALTAPSAPRYITVPQGHIWVTGDNLANSTDSRHYGPIPIGLVRGNVVARVSLEELQEQCGASLLRCVADANRPVASWSLSQAPYISHCLGCESCDEVAQVATNLVASLTRRRDRSSVGVTSALLVQLWLTSLPSQVWPWPKRLGSTLTLL